MKMFEFFALIKRHASLLLFVGFLGLPGMPSALADCPDGWGCVLADIMLQNSSRPKSNEVTERENEQLFVNKVDHLTPYSLEEVLRRAKTPPKKCDEEMDSLLGKQARDAETYCQRALLLKLASDTPGKKTGCALVNSKFNKQQCQVFSKAFEGLTKTKNCKGLSEESVAFCGCLTGAKTEKRPEKLGEEVYKGCNQLAEKLENLHYENPFKPGGAYYCGPKAIPSGECEKSTNNLAHTMEEVRGLSNLVAAIEPAAGNVPHEVKPYTDNDRVKLLGKLNSYFSEECKKGGEHTDGETAEISSCLYEKYRTISGAGLGKRNKDDKEAYLKLFDTAGKHKCSALSNVVKRIVGDVIPAKTLSTTSAGAHSTLQTSFKGPLSVMEQVALGRYLFEVKSEDSKRFESIKKMVSGLDKNHPAQAFTGTDSARISEFLSENPSFFESDHLRKTAVLGEMYRTSMTKANFMREGLLAGVTKSEFAGWNTRAFNTINYNADKALRNFKCGAVAVEENTDQKTKTQNEAACRADLRVMFNQVVPNVIESLTSEQKEYFKFYLENSRQICAEKYERGTSFNCEEWSQEQTKNALILRLVTPNVYPGVGAPEGLKMPDQKSRAALSKLFNSILNLQGDTSANSLAMLKAKDWEKPFLQDAELAQELKASMNPLIEHLSR